jgi:hypothetical protein
MEGHSMLAAEPRITISNSSGKTVTCLLLQRHRRAPTLSHYDSIGVTLLQGGLGMKHL